MKTQIAHLSQRSVRYLESGADGEPIVLLHAFPLSADQWVPQLVRVPPGRRVIAPDLRGFRGSGPAFEEFALADVTMDTYARDVLELMTHLDIPKAVIGGLSMGGYVAMAIARLAPTRVSGLILADTKAGADTEQGRAGRDRMLDLVAREGASGVAREMLPKLLGETTRRDQPDLEEVVRRMIEMNTSDAIAAAIRALKGRPDSTSVLSSMTVPTTIVCGADDVLTPPTESESMHRVMPQSRLVILPGAGHLSNLETPLAFANALSLGPS